MQFKIPQKSNSSDATATWLDRKEWRGGHLKSGSKSGAVVLWALFIFWCLYTIPSLIDACAGETNLPPFVTIALSVPLLFIGLIVLWFAVRQTKQAIRHGEFSLDMLPFPARIGQQSGVSINFASAHVVDQEFTVTWRCTYVDSDQDGTNRTEVWSEAVHVIATAGASDKRGAQLEARMQLPSSAPPSDPLKPAKHHKWEVCVQSQDARFSHDFEVPVLGA